MGGELRKYDKEVQRGYFFYQILQVIREKVVQEKKCYNGVYIQEKTFYYKGDQGNKNGNKIVIRLKKLKCLIKFIVGEDMA